MRLSDAPDWDPEAKPRRCGPSAPSVLTEHGSSAIERQLAEVLERAAAVRTGRRPS